LAELEQSTRSMSPLLKSLVPALSKIGDAYLRSQAGLHCAIAALGVERFRVQTGHWPDSLDDVVAAKLLDKVPLDVYDGKPLRYRKTADGVVVYSVGPYGTNTGKTLDGNGNLDPAVQRYELRLWDVNQRRQPPRPKGFGPMPGGELP